MKRVSEIECKGMPVGKAREKLLRSRNKRKCKRKKNARTIKRFCTLKEAGIHYTTNPYQRDRIHQTPQPYTAGSGPSTEVRLKHAQNVWIRTYQRIVKWHGKHQLNYWKQCAQQLQAENARLKRVMLTARPLANDHEADSDEDNPYQHDPYGDTEDESADEFDAIEGSREQLQRQHQRRTFATDNNHRDEPPAEEELDEEFLAFMEVSARHRIEHQRLKNESVH